MLGRKLMEQIVPIGAEVSICGALPRNVRIALTVTFHISKGRLVVQRVVGDSLVFSLQ